MNVVWAWGNLDNSLFLYNIKQYWLLMSVLSVKKFNPDWKRILVVDKTTASFIQSRCWDGLWDDVIIEDFSNTEYGNLYRIDLYSWPKLYSYGLFDEDVLMLDTDIVFVKRFEIPDRGLICGKPYNHINCYKNPSSKKVCNQSYKWKDIQSELLRLEDEGKCLNYIFQQEDICLQGAPLYVPKRLTKYLQTELIDHILDIEGNSFKKPANNTFYAIEEEYPLAAIAKRTGGFGILKSDLYKHGFIKLANFNITEGFDIPEKILNIPVFKQYLQPWI